MHTIKGSEPFVLENNQVIPSWTIGFNTYGKLNENRDNVIWVCHALTANGDVLDWWSVLFGKDKLFDPNEYFIVCPNMLGSCYGSTGPASGEGSQKALLNDFPDITTRDQAKWHALLREKLGLQKIKVLVGASLGGQQALEWSILEPNTFEKLLLIATNAQHSAFGIAYNESQRWAIENDPSFYNGLIDGGKQGLALARSIAMISYRTYEGYQSTQGEENTDKSKGFLSANYQRYQGDKLAKRFSAHSYHLLSRAMDSHNVSRGRGTCEEALSQVKAETLVIGISSDQLFPVLEQQFLAKNIPDAQYMEIDSRFGHDGFLIEGKQLSVIINWFLTKGETTTIEQLIDKKRNTVTL